MLIVISFLLCYMPLSWHPGTFAPHMIPPWTKSRCVLGGGSNCTLGKFGPSRSSCVRASYLGPVQFCLWSSRNRVSLFVDLLESSIFIGGLIKIKLSCLNACMKLVPTLRLIFLLFGPDLGVHFRSKITPKSHPDHFGRAHWAPRSFQHRL